MCLLHHISTHSDANRMDSRNLAVCFGPTLLAAEDNPTGELNNNLLQGLNTVASIIRLMMDNCRSIFGVDMTTLMADRKSKQAEVVSDMMHNLQQATAQPSKSSSVLSFNCTS